MDSPNGEYDLVAICINKWFDIIVTIIISGNKIITTCFLLFTTLAKCKELNILSCLQNT